MLGAGFGLGGLLLWLGVVAVACVVADDVTAKKRRADYLAYRAALGLPQSGLG